MSSNDIAVKVSNLSKCYQIYDEPHDRLKQFVIPKLCRAIPALGKLFPARHSPGATHQEPLTRGRSPLPAYYREFWALKDVSFEIRKGETVGIIGRNGSGKSTLLQMICGTLNPTSGSIQTHGRVAALLELGSGFNPEFTGRENVYLNAAVLGLSKDEIDARFDDIAAFADIGDFIEQPVKTYSSGMMVRLAFAVAINVDPQILVVDEALSVGDELFQRKCFSRIEAFKQKGVTILFVSHSGAQIVELCDRAMLIDAGEKLTAGLPKQIVGRYQKLLYAPAVEREAIREQIRQINERITTVSAPISQARDARIPDEQELRESFDPHLKPSSTIEYESHGAYIKAPAILTLAGERVNSLICGKTYRYVYAVHFTKGAKNVRFGMLIKTMSGVELGGAASDKSLAEGIELIKGGAVANVEYQFKCILNQGMYFMNAGVSGDVNGEVTYLHRIIDALCFRVVGEVSPFSSGVIDFSCTPELTIAES